MLSKNKGIKRNSLGNVIEDAEHKTIGLKRTSDTQSIQPRPTDHYNEVVPNELKIKSAHDINMAIKRNAFYTPERGFKGGSQRSVKRRLKRRSRRTRRSKRRVN